MKNTFLKIALIAFLIVSFNYNSFSTVMGPVYIDILGIDNETNAIYFVRTDWSECDCQPELFKYYIDNDSLVFIPEWAERYPFNRNKKEVIKEKGLDYLSKLDTVSNFSKKVFSFEWQPPIEVYSGVLMKDTVNYPFRLKFAERYFEYIMCLSKDKTLKIDKYELNENFGFVLCRYQGDCYEGNTRDKVIFFKVNGESVLSRELNVKDKMKEFN